MSQNSSQNSTVGGCIAGCVALLALGVIAIVAASFYLTAEPDHGSSTPAAHARPQPPANALHLVFTYGSEKKKWIADVTETFNLEKHKAPGGQPIFVEAIPLGSGESMDELLEERRQAHLSSPASAAFIKLANAEGLAAGAS